MDYVGVDMGILHTFPALGLINAFLRDAVRSFPDRLVRLISVREAAIPTGPDAAIQEVENEVKIGGSALQFMPGFYLVVEALAAAGADVNAKDAEGNPLLYHAIRPRGLNMVESLIEAGTDVNAKDAEGNPLLYHAILKGGLNVVQSIIKGGADADTRDAEGKTLLAG